MKLEDEVSAFLRQHRILPGSQCLVALSGGGDSVALLDLLSKISTDFPLRISAARVVHGIRVPQVEIEENALCSKLCRDRGISFTVLDSADESVTNIESIYRCGPEQAARELRHRLLKEHMNRIHAEYIMYGHTADDRLETIFMRLLSGSGPEGLLGISSTKGSSLRPLLGIDRIKLRKYLIAEHIRWVDDLTNDVGRYRRNRVRNELIPLIGEIFPGWPGALDTLGERSLEASESLREAASRQLPEFIEEGAYSWNEKDWDSASDYSKALALWDAFNHLDQSGIPDRRFSWRSLKEARQAVDNRSSWNAFELSLVRRRGRVVMNRQLETGEGGRIEGRLILNRSDVFDGFSSVIGVWNVSASMNETKGWRILNVSRRDWPIEVKLGGGRKVPEILPARITEKSSAIEYTDADKELVYIFIDRMKEGFDAGKQ